MDGYGAGFAELYDRIVPDDREDVSYYVDLATETASGPVLELACGTGRIYLELLAAGVDADGIDLSEDALDVLREKAADAGLDPSVRRGDLTDFSTDREYELAICPFNALQHALTVEDQLSCLRSVYEALAPGGRFAFDVFVPNFEMICEEYGTWETRSVQFRGAPRELRTRTRVVDEVEQQFVVENELYDADGNREFAETDRLKMLPRREVELLARLSPFEEWDVRGGFDGEDIADGDAVQAWTLRKSD